MPTTTPLNPPPWERQPDEPDKAFSAFCLYRDLGAKRSLDEAARRYHARPECDPNASHSSNSKQKVASGRIREWAEKYRWRQRAGAWDQELDRQARQAQVEAVTAMHQRHAVEALEFQQKAIERLRQIPIADLSPADTLKFYLEAVKIERLARGEPETIHEQRQKADRNDRDITQLVLADPRAADLACQLFERLAGGPDQPGSPGLARQPGTVETGTTPQSPQSQAD